jgi:hypothetical protein
MQPAYTVARLQESIERLEKRQQKNFKTRRESAILAAKERLHILLVRQTLRDAGNSIVRPAIKSVGNGSVRPAIDLSAGNPNSREASFARQAKKAGWTVTRRGWPDFLCWRGDDIVFVEVKPNGYGLDPHQMLIMTKLISLGLKCFKWTPSDGFTRLTKENLTEGCMQKRTKQALRVLGIA